MIYSGAGRYTLPVCSCKTFSLINPSYDYLLDVLAVLVQSGGADALQLPAREGRLQDVRRIDGALRRARAHQRVHLVDH
eukprot:3243695-Pyramimonas_sp.AAC.1